MNRKILKNILLGAWFIFLFYILFIPNRVHREGLIDQEQLSNKLFGAYSSHRYERGLNKEIALSGYAFIDKRELSKQDLNYKVADLKNMAGRKSILHLKIKLRYALETKTAL